MVAGVILPFLNLIDWVPAAALSLHQLREQETSSARNWISSPGASLWGHPCFKFKCLPYHSNSSYTEVLFCQEIPSSKSLYFNEIL